MKHLITFLILSITFPSFSQIIAFPSSGHSADEYIELGNTNLMQGDFESAYDNFSQAINLDKENAVAYYNRGRANEKMLNFKKAISDYSSAISISPNFIEASSILFFIVFYFFVQNRDDKNWAKKLTP